MSNNDAAAEHQASVTRIKDFMAYAKKTNDERLARLAWRLHRQLDRRRAADFGDLDPNQVLRFGESTDMQCGKASVSFDSGSLSTKARFNVYVSDDVHVASFFCAAKPTAELQVAELDRVQAMAVRFALSL